MTAKHTSGPLHLSRTSRWRMKAFDEAGNMVVSTDYSQHSTAQAIADIGRVVACWNACAGHEDPEDMARLWDLMQLYWCSQVQKQYKIMRLAYALQSADRHGIDATRAAVDALRGEHA